MNPRCYVAAPYADTDIVRSVHDRLRALDIEPTSRWADNATGPESFAGLSPEDLRGIAEANDRDLARANVVLVLSRHGAGAETYAEARYALTLGLPVVWVGRLTLSAWRAGVTRCDGVDEGIAAVARMLAPAPVEDLPPWVAGE